MKDLFRELVNASGLSGSEGEVRTIFCAALADYVDRIEVDRMGNVLTYKQGQVQGGPRLMLHAHLDEIGLMVSDIEESGIIRFVKIGFIDDRVLPSHLVTINTRQGKVPGLIGRPSPRKLTAEEKDRPTPWNKLFIDIGSFSRRETEARGVRIGDPITFRGDFLEWDNGVVVTKSCDDRIGLAILVEVMKRLAGRSHQATVIAAALSQHEVGLKGAATAAWQANPDIDVHVDITGNFPDDPTAAATMGGGPVIRLMEGFGAGVAFAAQRGVFCSRPVVDLLASTAERERLPYQLQIKPGIINDGVEIQPVRRGVHVGYVLVPARYNHSPHEMIMWDDVERTAQLLTAFCLEVNADFLAEADRVI
ncbi:MAG: M42 family peptidase [Gammaproteobacteria bacterium]|nr:M42 family peptidase [Gammaproteobacteria bacterium]